MLHPSPVVYFALRKTLSLGAYSRTHHLENTGSLFYTNLLQTVIHLVTQNHLNFRTKSYWVHWDWPKFSKYSDFVYIENRCCWLLPWRDRHFIKKKRSISIQTKIAQNVCQLLFKSIFHAKGNQCSSIIQTCHFRIDTVCRLVCNGMAYVHCLFCYREY